MRTNMHEFERTPQLVVVVGLLLVDNPSEYVLIFYTIAAQSDHRLQDKTRTTLTMEDLSAALSEYGINARKPEFYM